MLSSRNGERKREEEGKYGGARVSKAGEQEGVERC
jgi:hypothetical protein